MKALLMLGFLIFVVDLRLVHQQQEFKCINTLPYCGTCVPPMKPNPNHHSSSLQPICEPDYSGCVVYDKDFNCVSYGFGLNQDGTGVLNCQVTSSDGLTCQECYPDFELSSDGTKCIAINCDDVHESGACSFSATYNSCSEGFNKNGYSCAHVNIVPKCAVGDVKGNLIYINNKTISLTCIYCVPTCYVSVMCAPQNMCISYGQKPSHPTSDKNKKH